MELRAGVLRARQAAAAKTDRRHLEVAAVLLDQQVGGEFRNPKQRVGGQVDRHRQIDAAEPLVPGGQLPAGFELLKRQKVGRVAVDLVCRGEDEGCGRREISGRLEEVEGAVGIDAEVGLGLGSGPVVRRLRSGVHDQLDLRAVLLKDGANRLLVADVDRKRPERGPEIGGQPLGGGCRRGRISEEVGAHVVVYADHLEALPGEVARRLGSDQAARTGDYRDRHRSALWSGFWKHDGSGRVARSA
uniref:Unannotated protein n=1 Tax=freshwater metagenome TaxID=449393 RepID=A0A6J6A277_9ZZZZ